jgi:hypothetical protein
LSGTNIYRTFRFAIEFEILYAVLTSSSMSSTLLAMPASAYNHGSLILKHIQQAILPDEELSITDFLEF